MSSANGTLAIVGGARGWARRHWRSFAAAVLLLYFTGPSVEVQWQDAQPEQCPAGASLTPTGAPIRGISRLVCIGPALTPQPLPSDRSLIHPDSCGAGFSLRDNIAPRPEGGYVSFYTCLPLAQQTPRAFASRPAVNAVHQVTLRLGNVGIQLLSIGDQYLEGFATDR